MLVPWSVGFLGASLLQQVIAPRPSEEMSFIQKAVKPKRVSSSSLVTPMEFKAFMKKHGRKYKVGTEEYHTRVSLFQQRLEEIQQLNQRPHRLWTAGINRLADRTDQELRNLRGWRGGAVRGSRHSHMSGSSGIGFLSLSGRVKPLPDEVSWAHLNATARIRDQGACGSCWAIASATVLEAHSEIHMADQGARSFSTQELVSCVPNFNECGGKGGCDGATVELAFDWAMKNGLAQESEVPYTEITGTCNRAPAQLLAVEPSADAVSMPGAHLLTQGMQGSSFGMTGWERLPENGYEGLLRAVVERGPVAVSAAASKWFVYLGGIFDNCERDAVIDHAVTLMGYGADASLGQKYWLVQNSWGKDWGEGGRIRLLRSDGDQTETCGIDHQPELGTACKGGPTQVTVCGMCGLLYDSVVPFFGEPDADVHRRIQLGHLPSQY